jgi:ferric-dicitrate binding protein FerR (iron transport regulator)
VSEHQDFDFGRDHASAEEVTSRLLRVAGMRAPVPPAAEHRVRDVVLDEIRSVARARKVRRRLLAGSALLAVAAVAVLAVRPRPVSRSETVLPAVATTIATVERVEGIGVTRPTAAAGRAAIAAGTSLVVHDEIVTGRDGRLAFRLTSGASVRVDRGSRVRLVSATAFDLAEGAVYIDNGPGEPVLEVRTPLGLVKDVGTQFETRLESSGLRVRVRSGLVELHRDEKILSVRPGSEVQVSMSGTTTRTIPTFGPDWEWVTALAPPFNVDGRPLGVYLEYLCREQGWTLAYADTRLARDVSGMLVHGSVEGLSPADALSVVLSTSGLAHRLDGGHLVVSRAGSQ